MSVKTMPGAVMAWGIGVAIGGAVLIAVVPMAIYTVVPPNTQQWQAVYVAFDLVMQIARTSLPPLGAALIGAALVMRYLDRRLTGDSIADRPHRWHFPADERP